MNSQSTERRLKRAIESVTELKGYLERAVRKLDEETEDSSGITQPVDLSALIVWLKQQANHCKNRRDSESKDCEAFRFFHGKAEGFEAVLRFLEMQNGRNDRGTIDRGYVSARKTADTQTMHLDQAGVDHRGRQRAIAGS